MVAPYFISRYRFMETQMGNALMPMTKEMASLMTMKSSIVRQPPMQIILLMKPEPFDGKEEKVRFRYMQKGEM